MTSRQKLILLLVSTDSLNNSYKLVKYLDRADFPAKLKENLQPLLEQELIYVSGLLDNGTPFEYKLTEKGKAFLSGENLHTEILDYIKTMQDPSFLLQLTEAIIANENN